MSSAWLFLCVQKPNLAGTVKAEAPAINVRTIMVVLIAPMMLNQYEVSERYI